MPKRLLIAAGEAANSADALPFGVRELIDAADEVLVVTPALPTRFEWLASATDKAREQADERLQAVLGQIEELGTEASGTVGADDPLLAFEDALATFQQTTFSSGCALRTAPIGRNEDCSTSCFAGSESRSRSSRCASSALDEKRYSGCEDGIARDGRLLNRVTGPRMAGQLAVQVECRADPGVE